MTEFQLTTDPLRIDLLIVKKPPNLEIKKNIGRIFREHNVVEYKSPDESLGIADYMHVFGYAYIYAWQKNLLPSEITVSFVVTVHPRELFKHLAERGLTITEISSGIYEIEGEIWPVQIIESKKLSEDDNIWLESLKTEANTETLQRIFAHPEHSLIEMRAYMYALLKSTPDSLKEIDKMSVERYYEVLDELGLVDPEVFEENQNEWRLSVEQERRATEQERREKEQARREKDQQRRITAKRMLDRGFGAEDIAFFCNVPADQIDEFLANVKNL